MGGRRRSAPGGAGHGRHPVNPRIARLTESDWRVFAQRARAEAATRPLYQSSSTALVRRPGVTPRWAEIRTGAFAVPYESYPSIRWHSSK
jgi:hypothetical protein